MGDDVGRLTAVLIVVAVVGLGTSRFAIRESRIASHRRHAEPVVLVAVPMADLDEQHALDVERQQVATYLAAVAAAEETRRAEEARRAVIWARWTAVGRCEQPGGGEGGVEWTVQSSTYSGGLGISLGAWVDAGGLVYAPNAGLADPWTQMLIAETIYSRYGPSAWGCKIP